MRIFELPKLSLHPRRDRNPSRTTGVQFIESEDPMRHTSYLTICALWLALANANTSAQDNQVKPDQAQGLSAAPQGFDSKRDAIEHGKLLKSTRRPATPRT